MPIQNQSPILPTICFFHIIYALKVIKVLNLLLTLISKIDNKTTTETIYYYSINSEPIHAYYNINWDCEWVMVMNISKSVLSYVKRRNIELTVEEGDSEVWFWKCDNDNEPMVTYFNNSDGLTYKGYCAISNGDKQELPAWVGSEMKLKEVIRFLSTVNWFPVVV